MRGSAEGPASIATRTHPAAKSGAKAKAKQSLPLSQVTVQSRNSRVSLGTGRPAWAGAAVVAAARSSVPPDVGSADPGPQAAAASARPITAAFIVVFTPRLPSVLCGSQGLRAARAPTLPPSAGYCGFSADAPAA